MFFLRWTTGGFVRHSALNSCRVQKKRDGWGSTAWVAHDFEWKIPWTQHCNICCLLLRYKNHRHSLIECWHIIEKLPHLQAVYFAATPPWTYSHSCNGPRQWLWNCLFPFISAQPAHKKKGLTVGVPGQLGWNNKLLDMQFLFWQLKLWAKEWQAVVTACDHDTFFLQNKNIQRWKGCMAGSTYKAPNCLS